jgi:hypothetical protein
VSEELLEFQRQQNRIDHNDDHRRFSTADYHANGQNLENDILGVLFHDNNVQELT